MYKQKCYLKKLAFSNQEKVIEKYSVDVWCWTTDVIFPNKTFTVKEIAENCPYIQHLAPRTKFDYTKVIFQNVIEEYKFKNLFQYCPIKRIGTYEYLMAENTLP